MKQGKMMIAYFVSDQQSEYTIAVMSVMQFCSKKAEYKIKEKLRLMVCGCY
jgi:hypothetical protein